MSPRLPIDGPCVEVTDTTVTVTSYRFPEVHHAAWKSLVEWCEFHGIDPYRIPMLQTLTRNVERRRVEFTEYVLDEKGVRLALAAGTPEPELRRRTSQGETPPMPWPAEVLALIPEVAR